MTPEPHPLRCETCTFFSETPKPSDAKRWRRELWCSQKDGKPRYISIPHSFYTREYGCASHSSTTSAEQVIRDDERNLVLDFIESRKRWTWKLSEPCDGGHIKFIKELREGNFGLIEEKAKKEGWLEELTTLRSQRGREPG